jgi:hypothetical protein
VVTLPSDARLWSPKTFGRSERSSTGPVYPLFASSFNCLVRASVNSASSIFKPVPLGWGSETLTATSASLKATQAR